jgi:hypothetical protein
MPSEGKITRLMMVLAKTHDKNVSEREKGAALALRAGNGMATEYWRAIATAALKEMK